MSAWGRYCLDSSAEHSMWELKSMMYIHSDIDVIDSHRYSIHDFSLTMVNRVSHPQYSKASFTKGVLAL